MSEAPVIYVCTLAGTPLGFNEYRSLMRTPGGQHKLSRIEAKFKFDAFAVLHEKGNPVPTGFARVELRSVIFFPTLDADYRNRGDRRHDRDNYHMPYYKWLQDLLVGEKVIPDDRERCCIAHPVDFARGRAPMTLLTMELFTTLAQEAPSMSTPYNFRGAARRQALAQRYRPRGEPTTGLAGGRFNGKCASCLNHHRSPDMRYGCPDCPYTCCIVEAGNQEYICPWCGERLEFVHGEGRDGLGTA